MNEKMIIKEYLSHFFTYNELAIYLGIDFYDVERIVNDSQKIEKLFDRKTALKVQSHNVLIEKYNTQLCEPNKQLNEEDREVSIMAQYIVDNQCSVRDAAKQFGKGKTTVHKYMVEKLPYVSITLYKKVFDVLQGNKSFTIDYKCNSVTAMDEFDMLKNGYTIKEISKMLNKSYSSIQRDLSNRFDRISEEKLKYAQKTLHEHQMRFNK